MTIAIHNLVTCDRPSYSGDGAMPPAEREVDDLPAPAPDKFFDRPRLRYIVGRAKLWPWHARKYKRMAYRQVYVHESGWEGIASVGAKVFKIDENTIRAKACMIGSGWSKKRVM